MCVCEGVGPVWEVQSLGYARFTSLIVYTLAGDQEQKREKGEQQSQGKKRNRLPARLLVKKRVAF